MNDALVCLAILFALLIPIALFHVWAAGPLAGAAWAPPLKAPRLQYVPPAPAPASGGAARYRSSPVPPMRQASPVSTPWTQQPRTVPAPRSERPPTAPLPLAVQAQQAVSQ